MKMSKKIWALLAITIVTTILIIQPLNVYADQETVQEKVINALKDVAGIDLDKYDITVTNYIASPTLGYEEMYRGEEELLLTLNSKESQISVLAEYLNKRLISMYLYIEKGSPSDVHYISKLSEDPIIATREALSRLKEFNDNAVIDNIQKIIESAKNVADIADKIVGNIKCVVHIDPYIVESNGLYPVNSIYFMYSLNGAESPKSIGIHFENGFFKGFHDTWDLFSIGNEEVNVSREQAIAIAREQAIEAAEGVTLEFPLDKPIVAELRMAARDGSMLYHYWFVELPLIYPLDSSIYAWQLSVWADTGDVASSHPAGIYGVIPDTSDTPNNAMSQNTVKPFLITGIIATIVIISLVAALGVVVVRKKR